LRARVRLDDAAARATKTYPGGMRRRLDLAASLVGQPRILYLDEPTTGLDPRARLELWALIRELVDGGTTVLLTTQYLDEADHLADHIVIIDNGAVVATGSAGELKRQVGGHRVDVRVRQAGDLDEVARALERAGGATSTIDRGARRISVPADGGAEVLLGALRAVEHTGIEVDDLALRSPTLDEVFLALTGHTTSPADEPAA